MNISINYLTVTTPLGHAGAGLINGKIARLWLPEKNKTKLRSRISEWAPDAKKMIGGSLAERIAAYFKGELVKFPDTLFLDNLDIFSKKVYRELRQIKRGGTITYGRLAERCGKPKAARYIGSIMGKNKIPLIIPCHRVVRSDGAPGGFTSPGGPAFKVKMLELEKMYPPLNPLPPREV